MKAEGVTAGRDRHLLCSTVQAMKPIKTVKMIATDQAVHPPGTQGILVEKLSPRIWLVELRVPDKSLEGDAWYETVEVLPDEIAEVDDA